jgi:hypothetical protein
MKSIRRPPTIRKARTVVKEPESEFDRELVIESFGKPSAVAQAKWERALAKRGRPRRGSGAAVISVSVERQLLARADLTAKSLGISRSELIARGLRAALAATGRE